MKTRKNSISAVIIARNEELTINRVVMESVKILPKLTNKYEILVNDDASTDKTAKILNRLSQKYPFIKIYHQKKPLGIAAGFEFLYKKANFELIATNSGDGQYTVNDLPKSIKKMNEGYDLIIGKREQKSQYNLLREFISFCFNFLPKILFRVNLYDAGSTKLYKKKVLQDTKPISKSVFNEAERIIRAYKSGYKIGFVLIRHSARKRGRSTGAKFSLAINAVLDMLKLYYLLTFKT